MNKKMILLTVPHLVVGAIAIYGTYTAHKVDAYAATEGSVERLERRVEALEEAVEKAYRKAKEADDKADSARWKADAAAENQPKRTREDLFNELLGSTTERDVKRLKDDVSHLQIELSSIRLELSTRRR